MKNCLPIRIISLMLLSFTLLVCVSCHRNKTDDVLQDRVEALLSQMTLEEKVGQMNQFVGIEHIRHNSEVMTSDEIIGNTANGFYPGYTVEDIEQMVLDGKVGSFLHVVTQEEANRLVELSKQSRLGIPCLIGIDAIHGNAKCMDNTVYPTHIGLACSFDTAMARRIGEQTAHEMRAMNMHWTFDPNVEVARDPRWGRVGETFGEDPWLVSLMGVATTRGLQEGGVLACVKHMVGGSQPLNGTNGAPADISDRTLQQVFFPPFYANIQAGVATLMPSHNELNGTPCHCNRHLLTELARESWGFRGFVISDWLDMEFIHDIHHAAVDRKDAFRRAIEAGVDMHMHGPEWNEAVCALVREGVISEARIDESVRRILRAKIELGLFDEPCPDAATRDSVCFCSEHQATALQAAQQSIVLLQNNGVLPLQAGKYRRVLVTGINANDENIMGDWSDPHRSEHVWTVLRGLRERMPEVTFDFVDQGWDPRNMSAERVAAAARAAQQADLNIVVAGEYMMRWRWKERTGGEDTDRSNIDLVGLQNELIERVAASGKPTVLVLITGRPLGITRVAERMDAIVQAWEPGQFGGLAIADILTGAVNPSAKLAVTIPRNAGQLPMYYNHLPSMYFHPYAAGESSEPLWAFGYGLSYNTFRYDNMTIDASRWDAEGRLTVACDVCNTAGPAGTEIVQLYIRDCISTVTRPVKELRGFRRVPLAAGEKQRVMFELSCDDLGYTGANMRPVFEAGDFDIMVGASSRDCDLLKETIQLKTPTHR